MNRLLEKAQALFDRQRLAGKLKLFLLMLFSVLECSKKFHNRKGVAWVLR